MGSEMCIRDSLNTGEHGDRHSADVLQRDQISLLLLTVLEDVCVVVSENLETVLAQVLSIVQNGLDGGTVRLMAHVDGKSVVIIELWVLVDEEFGDQLTERWNVGAEELRYSTGEPVGAKELVNSEKAAGVREFIVEHSSELEDTSLGVRDLGHWSESNEERHFIREVTSSVL